MDDQLRDALATLGQRIEVAEHERREAVAEVEALLARHHADLHVPQVSQLTTLPHAQLGAMLPRD